MMNTAITADAIGRLNARPPSCTGLSSRSPTVAPSGRVRMKAAQNRRTFETLDQKYNPAITARPAVKTNAPPP